MGNTLEIIPGRMNIIARVGDDLSITLVAKQDSSAIDLTGYTFESKVDIGGSYVVFTVDNTDFATGIIVLTMTDTLSAGIPLGENSWYLDRTNAGYQRRWVSGDFIGIEYKK
jgi:hypothetical protein